MRIVYFHSGWDLYGASRSLLRLASAFRRDGHAVLAVLPRPGPLSAALRTAGVEVEDDVRLSVLHRSEFRFPQAVPFFAGLPGALIRCRRILHRFRPDLVHSNTGAVFAGALAAKLGGIPHLWHVRDMFDEFGVLWKGYGRGILAGADRVVCVSRAVAAQFDSFRGAAAKVLVLNNGFPPEEFRAPAGGWTPPVDELRRRWGVREGEAAIGILGRIKLGRKGHEVLARAARTLLERGIEHFRIIILGTPFPGNEEHEVRLRRLAGELELGDRFALVGEMEDPRPAYAALDAVVLASARPEPFGGVVIEAMAMGKPVVGTALGGTVEQIEDGATGFLVPPNDSTAMADALARLLVDPALRARMGAAGRQRFEAKFAFADMYARMLGLYREIVGAQKR
ncbi:MAG: glycosyltransferase [Verrucomicrobiae bacterium]|nr:glycosyltransferase [Verrucomicrobiae bacterium]